MIKFEAAATQAPTGNEVVRLPNDMTHMVRDGEAGLNAPERGIIIAEDGSRWGTATIIRWINRLGASFPTERVYAVASSAGRLFRYCMSGLARMHWKEVFLMGFSRPWFLMIIPLLGGAFGGIYHKLRTQILAPSNELTLDQHRLLYNYVCTRYDPDIVTPSEELLVDIAACFARTHQRGSAEDLMIHIPRIWAKIRMHTATLPVQIVRSPVLRGVAYGALASVIISYTMPIISMVREFIPRFQKLRSRNRPHGLAYAFCDADETSCKTNLERWYPGLIHRVLDGLVEPELVEHMVNWSGVFIEGPLVEETIKELIAWAWRYNGMEPTTSVQRASTLFGWYEALPRIGAVVMRLHHENPDNVPPPGWIPISPAVTRWSVVGGIAALLMHISIGGLSFPSRVLMHCLYNFIVTWASAGFDQFEHVPIKGKRPTPVQNPAAPAASVTGSLSGKWFATATGALALAVTCYMWWRRRYRPMSSTSAALGSLSAVTAPKARVASICTEHLALGTVRPGAVFTPRLLPRECKPSQPFTRIGPFCLAYHVFKFSGCHHNVQRAMTMRMGGVPAGIARRMDPEEDAEGEWERITDEIDRNILHDLPTTHPVLVANYVPNTQVLLTHNQWVKRFPIAKGEKMLRAWKIGHRLNPQYDCFVKSEKSVMDVEEFDKIEFIGNKALPSPIGVEGEQEVKLDPRGISVPEEALRVDGGPWCNYLNKSLTHGFEGRFFYNPGHTPLQLSFWFENVCYAVKNGIWPYAIAVQGDDILIVRGAEESLAFVNIDLSRYDMTQRPAHFACSWRLVDDLHLTEMLPRHVRETFEEQQGLNGDLKVYNSRAAQLRVLGTMASGDGLTITFNSLTILQATIFALENDPNNIERVFSDFGFTPTMTTATDQQVLDVDFLQSRPWMTTRGIRVFAPKPGRILSRFFYTDRQIVNEEKRKVYAYRMAEGLLSLSSHVPIINTLCRRVMTVTAPALQRYPKLFWEDGEAFELRHWRQGSTEEEHKNSRKEFCTFYGITLAELQLLEDRVERWEWMEPVDDTDELRRIVRLICSRDLL